MTHRAMKYQNPAVHVRPAQTKILAAGKRLARWRLRTSVAGWMALLLFCGVAVFDQPTYGLPCIQDNNLSGFNHGLQSGFAATERGDGSPPEVLVGRTFYSSPTGAASENSLFRATDTLAVQAIVVPLTVPNATTISIIGGLMLFFITRKRTVF